MTAVNFREEGIKKIQKAMDEDRKENYEEALTYYKAGLELLAHAIKYENNPAIKKKLIDSVGEWMERAENIKKMLDEQRNSGNGNKKIKSTAEGNTKKTSSADEDKSQLRTALQSAILSEKPNVPWDSIAGLEQAKNALKEAVIIPIKFPQLFTGNRQPWKGILLYGPPGTGKSYLAKAVATEANSTFFSVSSSDLVSKYQGESERLVKELFQMAREQKPSIIFIDEVDSLCGARGEGESESSRRIKTEFLVQMNGVGNDQSGILVLGATNIPWALDPAIRRRFEKRIYIPLPDMNARIKLIQINIGSSGAHSLSMEQIRQLAEMTEGYSGADIYTLVRDAFYEPIRKLQAATHFKQITKKDSASGKMRTFMSPCSPGAPQAKEMAWTDLKTEDLCEPDVEFNDFLKALSTTRKTVNQEDLKRQIQFTEEFGMEG